MNARNSRIADALYDPAADAARGRRLGRAELAAAAAAELAMCELCGADETGALDLDACNRCGRRCCPTCRSVVTYDGSGPDGRRGGEVLCSDCGDDELEAAVANSDDAGELPERWDGMA